MPASINHYATLGLARTCTAAEVRTAYRTLARLCHPDLHPGDPSAVARTQALNAAYTTLADPARRRAHDLELTRDTSPPPVRRRAPDIVLAVTPAELIRGGRHTGRAVHPGSGADTINWSVTIPPGTTPGTRLAADTPDAVAVRVKVRPDARFKPRGTDLRCDLRINARVAAQGGSAFIPGPLGQSLRVAIPPACPRGTVVRIPGEGLPRNRGGRGDLLVRLIPPRALGPRPPQSPTVARSNR